MERDPRFVGTTYREIERYARKIVARRNDNDKVRDGKNGGGEEEGEDSRSFGERARRGWKRTGRGARIFCLRRTNISTGIPSRNPEKSPLISRRSFDSTRPRASCSFARVNLRPLLPFKQSSELDQILATRFPPIVRSTGHWIYVWPAVVAIDRISPPGDIKRKVAKNRTKLELDQAMWTRCVSMRLKLDRLGKDTFRPDSFHHVFPPTNLFISLRDRSDEKDNSMLSMLSFFRV